MKKAQETEAFGVLGQLNKIDTLLKACCGQVDALTVPQEASCLKAEEPQDRIGTINLALDGVLDKVTHLNDQLAILTNLL